MTELILPSDSYISDDWRLVTTETIEPYRLDHVCIAEYTSHSLTFVMTMLPETSYVLKHLRWGVSWSGGDERWNRFEINEAALKNN